jgi:hypothetical protein
MLQLADFLVFSPEEGLGKACAAIERTKLQAREIHRRAAPKLPGEFKGEFDYVEMKTELGRMNC